MERGLDVRSGTQVRDVESARPSQHRAERWSLNDSGATIPDYGNQRRRCCGVGQPKERYQALSRSSRGARFQYPYVLNSATLTVPDWLRPWNAPPIRLLRFCCAFRNVAVVGRGKRVS